MGSVLRRAVLALTLLDDGALGDAVLDDDGVRLPAPVPGLDPTAAEVLVAWSELEAAAGPAWSAADELAVRRRLARWLRLRQQFADPAVRELLAVRIRPLALPPGHAVHPGQSWVCRTVLGGALDVGLGLRGVDDDGRPEPEAVGPLPLGVLVASRLDALHAVARADQYLTDMSQLAVDLMRRDPVGTLRPLGDADVLTLLASPGYRAAITADQRVRTAAVPSRRRGWLDLGRVDPAFAVVAYDATDPDERGFERAVLVTREEITLARPGGDPTRFSLADPAPPEPENPVTRGA